MGLLISVDYTKTPPVISGPEGGPHLWPFPVLNALSRIRYGVRGQTSTTQRGQPEPVQQKEKYDFGSGGKRYEKVGPEDFQTLETGPDFFGGSRRVCVSELPPAMTFSRPRGPDFAATPSPSSTEAERAKLAEDFARGPDLGSVSRRHITYENIPAETRGQMLSKEKYYFGC